MDPGRSEGDCSSIFIRRCASIAKIQSAQKPVPRGLSQRRQTGRSPSISTSARAAKSVSTDVLMVLWILTRRVERLQNVISAQPDASRDLNPAVLPSVRAKPCCFQQKYQGGEEQCCSCEGSSFMPICIRAGRPSLWPGTPGGSEEPTQAYSEVRRGERRSDNEGIHLKANRHYSSQITSSRSNTGPSEQTKAWP
jgi:hypothetical protein